MKEGREGWMMAKYLYTKGEGRSVERETMTELSLGKHYQRRRRRREG